MKKMMYRALLAAFGLAAVSCTISVSEFDGPVVEEDLVPMTFSAGSEWTRTQVGADGTSILFSGTEHVSVYDGAANRDFAVSGAGSQVEITGETSASATAFHALYPYDADAVFSASSGTVQVLTTLPAEQEAVAGSFADGFNLAAATASSAHSFTLQNVLSLAKFTLASGNLDGHGIISVELGSAAFPLAGDVVVTYGDRCTAVAGSETVSSVTLAAADGSVLADGTYYFTVLPNDGGEITLTFTDADGYTATKTATLQSAFTPGIVKNLGTVKGLDWEETEETAAYCKVTEDLDDWSGEYLIVYESDSLAFTGSLTSLDAARNNFGVTIVDGNKVEKTDLTAANQFTVAKSGSGYTIQSASGYYIGQASNANGLQASTATAYENAISYSGGSAQVVSSGGAVLRYNKSSGQERFRYFKSTTYSNQEPVQLYKLTASTSPAVFRASVITEAATGIQSDRATLQASFQGVDLAQAPQNVVFLYGTAEDDLSQTVGNTSVSTSAGTYSWTLTGLSAGTTYYFQASMDVWNPVTGAYATITGEVLSFTTPESSSPGTLDWAELPGLDYTHQTGSYDYYLDNSTHGGLYAAGSLYYTHHWTDVTYSGDADHYMRNYTACWSSDYRCPVWIAAPRHSCYTGSSGRTNKYAVNPDMPSSVQYTGTSAGNSSYNRGHMLGSEERTCSTLTNWQVFYTTNIAPQNSSWFNTGGGGWNILEDWVDGQVCSDTLYVVIGCYFDSFTDGYGNSAEPSTITFMSTDGVACPTMFYYALLRTRSGSSGKAVADCTADELQCAVFARAHAAGTKGQAVTEDEMMSVSALEQLTGFTFFANVPNAPKDTFDPSDWGL